MRGDTMIARLVSSATVVMAFVFLQYPGQALATKGPVKEVIVAHVGWDVNQTKEKEGAPQEQRNLCTVASKDICQKGQLNGGVRGFKFTKGVAGAPVGGSTGLEGNVYVADENNDRIQELAPNGEFLLMFGKDVNKKGGDVCTKAEAGECQAGLPGTEAGAFTEPASVAVDPVSGDIYVTEPNNQRVDKYTPAGEFLWMVGKEVDKPTKTNVCTEAEAAQCGAGVDAGASTEHGAFRYPHAVAVEGNQTLYVGDSHRVQEFTQEGEWAGEIRQPLEEVEQHAAPVVQSSVSRMAVDQLGDVFVLFEVNSIADTILEFDSTGKEINSFGPAGASRFIFGIAVDTAGRLAVVEEKGGQAHGYIYEIEGSTLRVVSEFEAAGDEAIAFNGADEMYATASTEIIAYEPRAIGELVATPLSCVPGAQQETDVTVNCDLNGTVDAWGVPQTEVWFQWGYTIPGRTNPNIRECTTGEETSPKLPIPIRLEEGEEEVPPVSVSSEVRGIRPDEELCYRLVGEDANVKAPELIASPVVSSTTNSVAPRIVGEHAALFAKATSSDLFAELNPENTATSYEFQYAPLCDEGVCSGKTCKQLEGCAEASHTKTLHSSQYGRLGVMLEVRDLQPDTKYLYRLYAINEKGESAVNEAGGLPVPEGEFRTAPIPTPTATTGTVLAVGQTTAVISGVVEPDGQEVAYSFEVGPYDGSDTGFTAVYSGSVSGEGADFESLALKDLQPGTTYAYRIAVKSGYIGNPSHTLQGSVGTFTTQPLATSMSSFSPTEILGAPPIRFPKPPASTTAVCRRGDKLNSHGRCVRTKSGRRIKRHGVRRRKSHHTRH